MKMKLIILFALCLLFVKDGTTEIFSDVCGKILSSDVISPKIEDVVFKLRTKSTTDTFDLTALDSIVTSENFDVNKKLVIYLSGFLLGLPETGVEEITNAYLYRDDANFVFIDSTNFFSTLIRYSAFNTQEIGEAIAQGLAKLVQEKEYPLEKIHIISHSLGVHIAGNVGRYFSEMTSQVLPRITGLDPAAGCFNVGGNTGLEIDNAEFIDVIHTNVGVFGTKDRLGHIDFYVGGLNPLQKGCIIFGCSHIRAVKYYAETVYPDNGQNFVGLRCPSENEISSKYCQGEPQTIMGYSVPVGSEGVYYLKVNWRSPYGKNAIIYV